MLVPGNVSSAVARAAGFDPTHRERTMGGRSDATDGNATNLTRPLGWNAVGGGPVTTVPGDRKPFEVIVQA